MKIYAFIFARGGSKGIKDKNLVKVKGKPLIYYSIKIAQKSKILIKFLFHQTQKKFSNMPKS